MPLRDEHREIIGVMQVLNKNFGVLTEEDEQLLDALGSQTGIALENSRLFEEVRLMKNYNASILRTRATGVVTLDPDAKVAFSNGAGLKIFSGADSYEPGQPFEEFFRREVSPDLVAGIGGALETGQPFTSYELQYH